MTDHRAWAKMLAEKALARFGARVWFMGLQGSVRRGAATESSDIDFVLILDRLDTADLSAYRELVRSMPDSEKACGFVSGRKELLAWPRADLFQFYHDTEALYGSLSEVGALLCPRDARAALHMGAANVYHAACHSFLFEDVSANLLRCTRPRFCPAGAGRTRVGRVL
ncbi:MAG: nucleotidyltransferase domain-containing protein [Ruthenibacterium lactatiformans]